MDSAGVVYELCYGIIPLRRHLDEWQVLLVQLRAGHWSFPKGHPEPQEEPHHCAARELAEETGLQVREYISDIPITEHYQFHRDGDFISKTVTYYLAEIAGEPVKQAAEINDLQWFSLDAAEVALTFPEARQVLREAITLLG